MPEIIASPIGVGSVAALLLSFLIRWLVTFLRIEIRRSDQQLIEVFNKELQALSQRNSITEFDKLLVEQAVHARFGSPIPYAIVRLAFSSQNASRFIQLLAQSSSFFRFTKEGGIFLSKTKSLDSERAWAIGAYFFFALIGLYPAILIYELDDLTPGLWVIANLCALLGIALAFFALKISSRADAGKAFVDEYSSFINDLPNKPKMSLVEKITFPFTANFLSGSTTQTSR